MPLSAALGPQCCDLLQAAASAGNRPAHHRPRCRALGNGAGLPNWLLATGTALYKVLLQFAESRPENRQN
jgi:hypothetical protein